MFTKKTWKVLSVSVAIMASSCGTVEQSNQSFPKIVGGTKSAPGSIGFEHTVALMPVGCTGTIVSENLIVTAAHCLNGFMSPTRVHFGADTGKASIIRKVTEFKSFIEHDEEFPNGDIGWVKFEGGLPPGFSPAKVLRNSSDVEIGGPISLVGFGVDSEKEEDEAEFGEQRWVNTSIEQYINNEKYKSLLILGPNLGFGACFGDSGGPAYVQKDGELYLVGATNGVQDDLTPEMSCEAGHDIYTFVGDYIDWIETTAKEKFAHIR